VLAGVKPGDCWSLISFRNDKGRNIELKFVACMQRQYEFTMDSFQACDAMRWPGLFARELHPASRG
jgi:hypothetical protein